MYPLVLPERAAIGERLPAEPTAVRPLARVDANVYLLGAAAAEGLAALPARERPAAQILVVRVTMADEGTAVRELLAALVAGDHFIAMRHHVPAKYPVIF